MCTAISLAANDHYFGRNLDLENTFLEQVTITPRDFHFHFRETASFKNHYAMIGMAAVIDNYPLYYDATNEHGLSIAALNFPGNASYSFPRDGFTNIASFELIPWLLGQFQTVEQVQHAFTSLNITNSAFSEALSPSPLHWMISDKNASIVIESTAHGLHIYDNPVHVLTNNPPFQYHLYNLQNYLNITSHEPANRFSEVLELQPYSRGMGAFSLPGDLSSSSRFVRAAFALHNSVFDSSEESCVTQFFHILDSVAMVNGCVRLDSGLERTIYSSCCNTKKCIYYYTTYENRQITTIEMFKENLDSTKLICYPLIRSQLWKKGN